MGCDIHAYVEYQTPGSERPYWRSFGQRMNPGRNYEVFAHLAGVRTNTVEPVVSPRGMPTDVGFYASDDSKLYIVRDRTPGEGEVTLEKAQQWVDNGSCQFIDRDGRHVYVTHPDWHTPSWLTVDEWVSAIERAEAKWPAGVEYHALTAAMRELEKRGMTVRIVFWFDN